MKGLVFILAALLAGSAFLPWLVMRPMFGNEPLTLSPWSLFESMIDPPRGTRPPNPSEIPPILGALYLSFVVAALVGLLSLFDMARRWMVLLAGAIPFIVIAWAIGGVVVELDRSGLPARDLIDGARMLGVDARSVENLIGELAKVLGIGFYLHYASALALVVAGFSIRERKVTT